MKRIAAVAIEGLVVLFCFWQPAGAQIIQRPSIDPPVAADRPTQRWLPLPLGDGADLNSRARILQQLQEVIAAESGGASLPKLSESQLRQMEGALEQLRDQIGEEKLPNLEDIPQEWINEALADPLIRKQAQQLLEQYARDRKLPNPTRNSAPASDAAVPFPRRAPPASGRPSPDASNGSAKANLPQGDSPDPQPGPQQKPGLARKPASEPKPGSARSRQAERLNDQKLNESQREQPIASENQQGENAAGAEDVESGVRGASPLPKKPDAERIEALKQLFERLKQIEGEKKSSGANAAQSTPSNKSPRGEASATRPSNAASRTPQSSSPMPRLSNPLGEKGMRSRVPNVVPDEQQPLPSDQDEVGLEEPKGPNAEEAAEGSASELRPDNPLLQDPKAAPLKPQNSANSPSSGGQAAKTGGGQGSNTRLNPPPSAAQQSKASGRNEGGGKLDARTGDLSDASSKPAKEDALDIKAQLERQGLGSTLKSLVEKTLREQGELDSKRKENAAGLSSKKSGDPSSGKPDSKQQKPFAKSAPQPSKSQKPSDLASSRASKQSPNKSPPNLNSAAQPNADANQPSSMSGLRDLAAQVWGAIRTTPGEITASKPSNVEGSDKGDSAAELGVSWGGAAWILVLVVVSVLALFVLLAKKRIELATAARTAEAKVAKELLADGIRTRADVVRAFHRFVLRRAQPVATWWNHRYVVSKLSQATPQLGSVISDLANVYEQARYLPPEVELSSDSLNQVQSALKQCAAGSA